MLGKDGTKEALTLPPRLTKKQGSDPMSKATFRTIPVAAASPPPAATLERAVTRRDLVAGGIAMLVLAAAAAGVDKAQELDGELLALCNEACDIHAGSIRIEDEYEARGLRIPFETVIYPRTARWHDLCAEIAETPARTPEGIRAKARVLADVIALDEPMVASLCADLLGRSA
jgi:hypothetical protein